MGEIDNYHKWLEEAPPSDHGSEGEREARFQELMRMTKNIREVPTKVGLAQTGLRLTAIVAVLVCTFFILLRIFALPKFDYIVEKTIGG